MCAAPRAPPPESTRPMRGRLTPSELTGALEATFPGAVVDALAATAEALEVEAAGAPSPAARAALQESNEAARMIAFAIGM